MRVGNIVPLKEVWAQRIDADHSLYPELYFVLEHWDRLRGDRFAPPRAEIDAADLAPVLAQIALIDVDETAMSFQFRLAGTGLYDLHDADISHTPVSEIRPEAYRDLLISHYGEVVAARVPNAYQILFNTENGGQRHFVTLRVPLSDDGERVTGIMTIDRPEEGWWQFSPAFDPIRESTG